MRLIRNRRDIARVMILTLFSLYIVFHVFMLWARWAQAEPFDLAITHYQSGVTPEQLCAISDDEWQRMTVRYALAPTVLPPWQAWCDVH